MAQALPPDDMPMGQSGPQQHSATADATKIAKILAKIMKIFILNFFSFFETKLVR